MIDHTQFTSAGRREAEANLPDERVHRVLRGYGLTEYETRAFLNLILEGEATPRTLSRLALIPYARVYGTLKRLEEMGWIESRPGRPIAYRAKEPAGIAQLARGRSEQFVQQFVDVMRCHLQPLYERREILRHVGVWFVHGMEQISQRQADLVGRSTSRAYLVIGSISSIESEAIIRKLAEAISRNIDVKAIILSDPSLANQGILRGLARTLGPNLSEIHVERPGLPICVLAADGREVIVTLLADVGKPALALSFTDNDLACAVERWIQTWWTFVKGTWQSLQPDTSESEHF